MYDVHEAYTIFHKANIVKESCELLENIIASSKVFTKKGRGSPSKAFGNFTESNAAKVSTYTCGKYILIQLLLLLDPGDFSFLTLIRSHPN